MGYWVCPGCKEVAEPSRKQYLGDSVYVDFDGYYIELTTNNGYPDDPRNKIYLEPQVYESLLRYVENLKESANDKQRIR
jgi:hypothetical protein